MEKLAEEIWRILWSSTLAFIIIISVIRYTEREDWWKIDIDTQAQGPNENGPLIFYSVKGVTKNESVVAQLFIKNILQEKALGQYGVFENIYPGQAVSLQINWQDKAIRSPSFILRDQEISSFYFYLNEKRELEYKGIFSRNRKNLIHNQINNFPWDINPTTNQLSF